MSVSTAELRRTVGTCTQRALHPKYGPGPWECAYCSRTIWCGCYVEDRNHPRAQVDHIYPVIRGGKNDVENLAPACAPCNIAKGMAIYPHEWTPGGGVDLAAVGTLPPLNPGGKLSARAYGVLTLVSQDRATPITPQSIAERFVEGRDAIRVAIGELVAAGHLHVSVVIEEGNLIRWRIEVAR